MTPAAQPTANVPASNLQSGARVALLGMVINVVLAIAKIAAGVLGNAYALIADGIESTLDIGGSVVIWGGLKFAARPPDETHPYGHGKAEPIAAAIVAVGVIAAAVGLAVRKRARNFHCRTMRPRRSRWSCWWWSWSVKEFLYRSVMPARAKCGKHRRANGRVASSLRCAHFDRRLHRHLDRADRRRGLGKRRRLGGAFRLRADRDQRRPLALAGASRNHGYRAARRHVWPDSKSGQEGVPG